MLIPHNEDDMNKNDMNELHKESANNVNDLDVAENVTTTLDIEKSYSGK